MTSVWSMRAPSSGRANCIPLFTASSPSDWVRPYMSSMRSASWTISEISRSTGSPTRSYSWSMVSKEQASPRLEKPGPYHVEVLGSLGRLGGVGEEEKLGSGVDAAPDQPYAGRPVHMAP